jgi:hypothetical protein
MEKRKLKPTTPTCKTSKTNPFQVIVQYNIKFKITLGLCHNFEKQIYIHKLNSQKNYNQINLRPKSTEKEFYFPKDMKHNKKKQ